MPNPPQTSSTALPFETASWARRAGALLVDWVACTLVVSIFTGWGHGGIWILLAYVAESALLTATVGGSFGKLATRLRTVRAGGDPRPVDLVRALARQILVALVIPPLVFRPDGRGLHDLAADTATTTLATYRTTFRNLPE